MESSSSRKRLKASSNSNHDGAAPSDQSTTSLPLTENDSDKAGNAGLSKSNARTEGPAQSPDGGLVHNRLSLGRPWSSGTWSRNSKATPSTKVNMESILSSHSEARGITGSLAPKNVSLVSSQPTGQKKFKTQEISAEQGKLNGKTQSSPDKGEDHSGGELSSTSLSTNKSQAAASQQEQPSTSFMAIASTGSPGPQPLSSWQSWFSRQTVSPQHQPIATTTDSAENKEDPLNPPIDSSVHHAPNETKKSDTLSSQQRASWLPFWNGAAPNSVSATVQNLQHSQKGSDEVVLSSNSPGLVTVPDRVALGEQPSESKDAVSISGARSSGWAFWSKDTSKATPTEPKASSNGTSPPTENQQTASFPKSTSDAQPPSKSGKRARPMSVESDVKEDILSSPAIKVRTKKDNVQSSPQLSSDSKLSNKVKGVTLSTPSISQKPTTLDAKSTLANSDLLLPTFHECYKSLENPSILEQITRFLRYNKEPAPKHLKITKEKFRIKKALAIGVHGYFPPSTIRTMLGQPTGTSIKFANSAAEAIQKWTSDRGYSCKIEKVALEGEGKIAERIETLWKLMLNWIEHIKKADFILLACHSQGVPVTLILLAKLVEFGCISSARIGVCAMAGVNLGPFIDYKSKLFSSSVAGELFEFSDPQSNVSQKYLESLDAALQYGVKIVYVGSIDDQLVSLESSLFATVNHPYIYRAVFVDGRIHAPDFITHLVGFALKLRNLGISDHGLIRELSAPLAGSLYSGEGHSRIYEDQMVYDLAVRHTLETTSIGAVSLKVSVSSPGPSANPYILPWSMRGLLDEDYVRTELDGETQELLNQFEAWKPSSKALKDVKFRLEAVKSRL